MSRLAKVKMHRELARGRASPGVASWHERGGLPMCLLCPAPGVSRRSLPWRGRLGLPGHTWAGRASVFVVQPGEPGRKPVDRRLELRRDVHELPQPLCQPAEADLFAAPPIGKLLDAAVGEVHGATPGPARARSLPCAPRRARRTSPGPARNW